MSKSERVAMYQTYLTAEGYVPKLDDDGDLAFKYEGRLYVVILDDMDDVFVRLVFPNFWPIESAEERGRVVRAAQVATAQTKVAKIFVVEDNVWGSVELFCSPPEVFTNVFRRSMSALQAAVEKFAAKMREDSPK